MNEFQTLTDSVLSYNYRNPAINQSLITYQKLITILDTALPLLQSLPTIATIPNENFRIIGDLHGIYEALIHTIPAELDSQTTYIFLGDYVDRGFFSVEILFVLLTLFIKNPIKIILLRGNHETIQQSEQGGFLFELYTKYTDHPVFSLYSKFISIFHSLQLICTSPNSIFIHGGPAKQPLSQNFNRFREINMLDHQNDPLSDLLWSDYANQIQIFTPNTSRGIGSFFSDFKQFCDKKTLFRGHSCVDGGIQENNVITVFSAPNYEYSNKGAYFEGELVFFTCKMRVNDMPIYNRFSINTEQKCVQGIIANQLEFEIKPKFDTIKGVKIEKKQLVLDFLELECERNGKSKLNLLQYLDFPERCLYVEGKSFEQLGYVVPEIWMWGIEEGRLGKILAE